MKDTFVRGIDPELWRRLKSQAALEDKTLGQAVNEALEQWLKERKGTRMAEYYRISNERVEQIAAAAGLSADRVRDICTSDWSEGQEHQDWLDTAPVGEIASWAAGISRDMDDLAAQEGEGR